MYRIAIAGPESTGKSELAIALAKHFGAVFVPEFARSYIETLNRPYGYDDVCAIATKQIQELKEFENLNAAPFVFYDTELIITKIWFAYRYQTVPHFLETQLQKKNYDFYLLCYPDLEWIPDSVREHGGQERMMLYELYKSEIEKSCIPFAIIKGLHANRMNNAIQALEIQFAKT